MEDTTKKQQVIEFAKKHTLVRPRDLERAGLPKDYLYQLAMEGVIVKVGRGLYQWPETDSGSHQALIEVAKKVPNGIVALISALSFHELTTQNPYVVWLAIDRKARLPVIESLAVRFVYFSGEAMTQGVEEHRLSGVGVKIFCPAKTVADCFKYRNKIGLDVALEALREGWNKKRFSMDELYRYAKVCRVQNVMRPYLEAMV
jgi:predicted transcriptional regulator of viral defense system